MRELVVILDGKVTTLVNHRQRHFHISLIIIKLAGCIILSYHLIQVLIEMRKQAHQISRRTTLKPETPHVHLIESIQDAERIENINKALSEMITVIFPFENIQHFLVTTVFVLGKLLDWLREIFCQFFFGNTTDGLIITI